jgi:hypothetical protein
MTVHAFVLSFEPVASFEGGEIIIGVFDSAADAMEHGDNIVGFDCLYVREFEAWTVLRSWRKNVERDVVGDWNEDASPDTPFVSYREFPGV